MGRDGSTYDNVVHEEEVLEALGLGLGGEGLGSGAPVDGLLGEHVNVAAAETGDA